jgi:hypothetical protein
LNTAGRSFVGGFCGCLGAIAALVFVLIVISVAATCAVSQSDIADVVETVTVDREFTVMVGGTSGLRFAGSCMTTSGFGSTGTRSLQGEAPQTYYLEGQLISCAFQKMAEQGTLTVEIRSGGKLLEHATISAPYGVASAATTGW